jgi:hypothetical protein
MSSEYRARTVLARNAADAHQSCAKRSRCNELVAVGTWRSAERWSSTPLY